MSDSLPFVLTGYGLPHLMGYLPTKNGDFHAIPVSPSQLLERAQELGLTGIEVPLDRLAPVFDGKVAEVKGDIDELIAGLRERNMRIVADYGVIVDQSADHLRDYLRLAAKAGARVVRAMLSTLLCGDRRPMSGGWDSRLDATVARLQEVLPLAKDLGLCIAVENHQDASTEDLLRLYERVSCSSAFGITLDTGNPLSVGEEPVETARALAPIIRHLHLKDYTIHFAPEGYHLVRCAAGDGVINFPAILEIVRANGNNVLPGIEIAAQATRTIPILDSGWWDCHTNRSAHSLLGALQILWKSGRPAGEPYSSVWEQGADSETVATDEWRIVQKSVEYFRSIN